MKFIQVNNFAFHGSLRASKITAVWAEKTSEDWMAKNLGEWRVMIRADKKEYLYRFYDTYQDCVVAMIALMDMIQRSEVSTSPCADILEKSK